MPAIGIQTPRNAGVSCTAMEILRMTQGTDEHLLRPNSGVRA